MKMIRDRRLKERALDRKREPGRQGETDKETDTVGERDERTGVLPREGLEIKIDTERERQTERQR